MVPTRIVFMGTAPLAAESLGALIEANRFDLLAAVTQPDRPKGRSLKPQPSAVKAVARHHDLRVLQPEKAREPAFIDELRALAPELIVVAAYGQILPQAVLDIPKHGCVNVHASLLPRWRGAAPIQWAIIEGDTETGVTIMKMDAGLDTGGILTTVTTPIHPEDNAQILHDRLARLGAELLVPTLPEYVAGRIVPRPQPTEGVTYARKLAKEDGCLDWTQPARSLWNRVRAFTPWPGAFTHFGESGNRHLLKIWECEVAEVARAKPGTIVAADRRGLLVAAGENGVSIKALQRAGGRRLGAQDFLAGTRLEPGQMLG